MSKTYTIYTAGEMGGLTYDEQMEWRLHLQNEIEGMTDANVKFIHPPNYYRYDKTYHKSEKEVMDWDLSHAINSDIVVVLLSNIHDSIGTHIEIGAINTANRMGKQIYIIGVGRSDTAHPWIDLNLHRQEDNIEDAADYIAKYLLV